MKNRPRILLFLISTVLTFTACEEVIDLELNDAGQRIVIEGVITLTSKPCMVKVTTSGDFYTGDGITPVTDATVEIFSSDGQQEILKNAGSGLYFASGIEPHSCTEYTVKVTRNNITYTASDTLPQKSIIEDLSYSLSDIGGEGQDEDDYDIHYDVNCQFKDEAGVKNYYLFYLERNGIPVDGRRGKYFLLSDEYLDGEDITYTFLGIGAELQDTLSVTLSAIGPATYEYYRTLNDALSQGGMGSTPYNPISNFDNNM